MTDPHLRHTMRSTISQRVLVIDDSPGDAELALIALEGAGGSREQTTVATTLAAGLAHLATADVVLLDLELPDVTGLDGLQRLRESHPAVPIILLTGHTDVSLAEAALRVGAQDYLLKHELTAAGLERAIRYASSRQELAREVARAERWANALIHSLSDIISIHAADGTIEHLSDSGTTVLGWTGPATIADLKDHVEPATWSRMKHTFERWRQGDPVSLEFAIRVGDGTVRYWESVATNMLDDPGVCGIVVTTRDVTGRRVTQDRLSHQAWHDDLTDLPNRKLLAVELGSALERQRTDGNELALLLIDLDNFKKINDTFGHSAGDEVLRSVAALFSTIMREGDTIARLGGDEFVFLSSDADRRSAVGIAERLQRLLLRPFGVRGHQMHLTASIGVALAAPGAELTPSDVLRNADLALYRTKEAGRNGVTFFDEGLERDARRRIQIEEELRGALKRDEFSLVYQPIVDLHTGQVAGFETLLRWENDCVGKVDPDEFIPIAEECGLILPIGAWVIERACLQLAAWQRQCPERPWQVAVNVSPYQLADPAFVSRLQEVLRETHVPARSLSLELTESALIEDVGASAQILSDLKAIGVRLSIDDFGTGYSSLSYLKRLPVDTVKIDSAFVAELGQDHQDVAILAAIIQLSRAVGVDVVAEGVENEPQLNELRRLGCQFGQGYLWSRPVQPSAVAPLLRATFDVIPERVEAPEPVETPELAVESRHTPTDGDAVAILVHELLQPTTVIKGFAETLREMIEQEDYTRVEQATAAIERHASAVETLVRSVADAGAMDRDDLKLELRRVDLASTVAEIVGDLRPVLPGVVEMEVGATVDVDADVDRFRQIIGNLVTNAAKFSPEGAPVIVRVGAAADGGGLVTVIDSGPGVPPDREAELFHKFAELGRHKGAGVGLYLARRFARSHGGDVTYRRADTGGAAFTLTLPPCGSPPQPASGGDADRRSRLSAGGGRASEVITSHADEDPFAVAALHGATRRLLRAEAAEEVVGITIELVRDLGGSVVPADLDHPDSIPVDVAFGEGPPLLPMAPLLSVARLRLERTLPLFMEDARDRIQSTRAAGRKRGHRIDAGTGLLTRRALTAALTADPTVAQTLAIAAGDASESESDDVTRILARAIRLHLAPGDLAGRWRANVLMAAIGPDHDANRIAEDIHERWRSWGRTAPLSIGVAHAEAVRDRRRLFATAARSMEERLP